MDYRDSRGALWKVSPTMWDTLKPLARQKRHKPTAAEDLLWQSLRNRQLAGLKFRRQHGIERFLVDFYCAESKLVIELDGPIHDYQPEEDAIRQQFLEQIGLTIIRFTNEHVFEDLHGVLHQIEDACNRIPPDQITVDD